MAVYTPVPEDEAASFLKQYDLPAFLALKGIAEGTENTTYLLLTEARPYILTLYEKRVQESDLPFFMRVMGHLADGNLPCPRPVPNRRGQTLGQLCGRPAALTTFLNGASVRHLQPTHCREVGRMLGHMHVRMAGFGLTRPNTLDPQGWADLLPRTEPDHVQPGLGAFLREELESLLRHWPSHLPQGVIHADLFPDNVLFHEGRLSGVIDFCFACTDFFAYELGICLNAWCFEDHVSFNITKARHLLSGYQDVRPLTTEEVEALPWMCRGAAMRFLLTRLADWPTKPPGVRRNPQDYLTRLRFHQQVEGVSAYGLTQDPPEGLQ